MQKLKELLTTHKVFIPLIRLVISFGTCNLVLITSAGVTSDAAGTPAIAPASRSENGWL